MKLPRRTFIRLAAGAGALPLLPRIAPAQAYPSRPVRIVVGLAAGSAPDRIIRVSARARPVTSTGVPRTPLVWTA